MQNISIIGIGKLGLCLALNLANSNYNVLGMDLNSKYVENLNNKKFISNEPQVNELLVKVSSFRATTNLKESLLFADIIFLMVATPSLGNGKYDHSQIENVLNCIESFGKAESKKILIVGCTTYPGYCDSIHDKMLALNYEIVYNPEFIAQGDIINGQLYPDFILIGSKNIQSANLIANIYENFCCNSPEYKIMSLTEAELTKLALNCFVTLKISFANMIGDLCNKLDISYTKVLEAIGSDTRIGNKCLKWGYGFGGPCFPRDNRALGVLCSENGILPFIPKSSDEYNNIHVKYQAEFIKNTLHNNKKITFDNVTYKKGTDSIVESQKLEVAKYLTDLGIQVTIKDKKNVIEEVKKIYADIFIYEEIS